MASSSDCCNVPDNAATGSHRDDEAVLSTMSPRGIIFRALDIRAIDQYNHAANIDELSTVLALITQPVWGLPLLLLVFWATGHRLSDVPSDEQWMIHGTLWILTFVCNFFAVKQILKLMLQAKRAGAGGV